MLKDILKKVSILLIASATLIPSALCYAIKDPSEGSNITRAERVQMLHARRNALEQERLQLKIRVCLADSYKYSNLQEIVDAANRFFGVDFSQLSENELMDVPMSMLVGTIVSHGSTYITNLKIDNFSSDLQDLIRSADDLHNKFEDYRAEVQRLEQE